MLEGELLLALDPRKRLTPDQIARLESVENLSEVRAVAEDPLESAAPKHPADDGRIEKDEPLGRRERVEPRREKPANRGRQMA
jgi:hypothetical protein